MSQITLQFSCNSGLPRNSIEKCRGNSRMFQGSLSWFSRIFKPVWKCHVAAPIWEISVWCIKMWAEFKDFKHDFQNSRTFQGSSPKFSLEFKDLSKDFKAVSYLPVESGKILPSKEIWKTHNYHEQGCKILICYFCGAGNHQHP